MKSFSCNGKKDSASEVYLGDQVTFTPHIMQRSLALIVIMMAFARSFTLTPRTISRSARSFSLGITPPTATYLDSDRLSLAVTASTDLIFKGDLLVIPFYKPKVDKSDAKDDKLLLAALKQNVPTGLSPDIAAIVADLLEEGVFKADVMSKQLVRLASSGSAIKYIALVGLGANPKKGDNTDLEIASASRLGKTVAIIAKEIKAGEEFCLITSRTPSINLDWSSREYSSSSKLHFRP